ncbi:MAG: bifunctional diguanylate cyclase/phosphodiesterase [Desulfovibrio sp.]|nr:bifunctional diguanylate cyclase/phosphodiesterase [Desulfovibrio sp.]
MQTTFLTQRRKKFPRRVAATCAAAALALCLHALLAPGGVHAAAEAATAEGGHAVPLLLLLTAVLAAAVIALACRNARYSRMLHTDTLTGLPSPARFTAACAKLLAATPDEKYALLSGDIRQFKTVNDQFGFARGDNLLRAIADTLRHEAGPGECCARLSADRFAMLLRFRGWDELHTRIRRLADALDAWRVEQGLPYKIYMAYGAYQVRPAVRGNVPLMLDLANYARLETKRLPDVPVVVYDEHMRRQALLQQELTGRLEDALAAGELQVWYQAKMDMRSGGIIGSEALARWNHPVRGMLLPRSFIPPLERNGLVSTLDFYIFEQACRNLRSWKLRNLPLHPVSSNFSRLHFQHADFPLRLAEIAKRHNVPTNLLEVEITEAAIIQNPEAAWMQLIRLRELGFKTVIDDFGTGHSALSILQMLCADAIKIDRDFIRRDLPGQRAQTVLGHIIRMARDLDMNVICEGVENAEQAAIIMKLGCSVAQGYFYAKAEPAYEFEARLAMQGL